MPPHRVYIESHLGGGAVLRNKRRAEISIGIDADSLVIERWRRESLDLCTLVHGDAVSFLTRYKFAGDELVYCDPPYVPEVRRRAKVYRHDYAIEDHELLLSVLRSLRCHVIISGYESALYRDRLSDWRAVSFRAQTHAGPRQESVWLNFAPPDRLHDGSHLGRAFRERQSIRRRHARWIRRIGKLEAVERNHLLRELERHFGSEAAAR